MAAWMIGLALASALGATAAGEKPVAPYVQSAANAGATPVPDRATFAAFHGMPGLRAVASGLVERNLKDPRLAGIFANVDAPRFKRLLAEQFCYLLGGGCTYTGRDMAAVHHDQGLQTSDFNAVVENLQSAMDAAHVPFRAQNVLLAKLAPMERVVVERKSPAALKSLSRRLASLAGGG